MSQNDKNVFILLGFFLFLCDYKLFKETIFYGYT